MPTLDTPGIPILGPSASLFVAVFLEAQLLPKTHFTTPPGNRRVAVAASVRVPSYSSLPPHFLSFRAPRDGSVFRHSSHHFQSLALLLA